MTVHSSFKLVPHVLVVVTPVWVSLGELRGEPGPWFVPGLRIPVHVHLFVVGDEWTERAFRVGCVTPVRCRWVRPAGRASIIASRASFIGGWSRYWCNCTSAPGWSGRLCETDYDDCLSTPCPRNYTCIDQVNGYVCECGNPSWPCAGYLEAWQICLIVMAAVLLLVLVMVVWRKLRKSRSQHHGDKKVNGLVTSKADSATGPDRDRPDTCKVRHAWEGEDDNTPDRQAAALLNWEWNPNRSAESRDLPSSLLSGAVTELKLLRGTLLKPTEL
ncbi:hypothetical protein Bbelb_361810 [Branchiostoma belcheri]|nr:hypothetical protein Bbelb_361810 [Branchiostoma belcheri]